MTTVPVPRRAGFFLVLEGIDGSGKSTLAEDLARYGRDKLDLEVCATREPGGTPLAEHIRKLLLNADDVPLAPEAEVLLHFAARASHVREYIAPALERGALVISERFTASTYAYQGSGLGMSSKLISLLEEGLLREVQPDLVLLLDLSAAEAHERIRIRGGAQDRYQCRPRAFSEAVRRGYLELARQGEGKGGARYAVVDASCTPSEVARQAREILAPLL